MTKFTVEQQPTLRLTKFQVINSDFVVNKEHWGNVDITNNTSINLTFSSDRGASESLFSIFFEILLKNEDSSFKLKVVFLSVFEVQGVELNDAFFESHFAQSNGPAIVFPYIRAAITSFLTNAGLNPIYLPTFNFTKIKKVE